MRKPWLVFTIFLALLVLSCEKKQEFNGTLYDKPAKEFCLTGWKEGKEKKVCLSDFKGKVVLMFFGYTHCPDVCPAALQVLSKTMNSIPERAREKVQVIFISVDPERDTPEIAQKYAEYFYPSFIGLTGSPSEIEKVAKNYMAFYKKVETESKTGYLVDHTAYIYLIDPEGNLKLIYPSTRQKPELMAQDIDKLL
ncbi:protein SCO1/2 [Hydrogenivirga caldilitoris]|uniref:Protein SCO1/2 n=1 Tax=Hydrogenivirga caldilitoris TaxID=246264 RepID=A0A497XRM4_9AQUI|nr:SCO family protein [Hydrogenivirga caldilitoris]RLJ70800.1 protein SCO1/2 [Hydrogenivirga caldilitoris]